MEIVDVVKIISATGTWPRYVFMATTLFTTVYILYRYNSDKILNNSIKSLRENLEIKDSRISTLVEEIKKAEARTKVLELEVVGLKVKTDLSEVLKMLGNLSETFGREHTSNIEMLQLVVKNIQEQQTTSAAQLKTNNELLLQVFDYVKSTWHDTSLHKGRRRQHSG